MCCDGLRQHRMDDGKPAKLITSDGDECQAHHTGRGDEEVCESVPVHVQRVERCFVEEPEELHDVIGRDVDVRQRREHRELGGDGGVCIPGEGKLAQR